MCLQLCILLLLFVLLYIVSDSVYCYLCICTNRKLISGLCLHICLVQNKCHLWEGGLYLGKHFPLYCLYDNLPLEYYSLTAPC
ncbi:hypothetical protein FKM82_019075 [Ascaphus truei]